MAFAVLAVSFILSHVTYALPSFKVFNGVPSSCFPSSTGLGSSFDVDLAHKVGEALADEARAKGLIANLHSFRAPLISFPKVAMSYWLPP